MSNSTRLVTNQQNNGGRQLQLPPLMVGADQTARLLGISRTTLYAMHANGQLGPCPHKYGRRSLWERAELEAWIKAGSPSRQAWGQIRGKGL